MKVRIRRNMDDVTILVVLKEIKKVDLNGKISPRTACLCHIVREYYRKERLLAPIIGKEKAAQIFRTKLVVPEGATLNVELIIRKKEGNKWHAKRSQSLSQKLLASGSLRQDTSSR